MGSTRNRRNGISLIEVMVAVALVALLAALAFTGSSGGNEKLHSSSFAKIVRDALLQSRSQARATGLPTGIAFPGTNTFGAQGYYQVAGTQRMRVMRPKDYSGEFSMAYVTWAPSDGESVVDRLESLPYNITTMTGLNANDPMVLFLPSGEVLTRGVPFDGTHYHLRVGSQPTGSAGGLSGLSNAWDLKFDANGSAALSRDTSIGPGSGSGVTTAALPPPSANPTDDPVVTSLKTFPELVENSTGLILATPDEPMNLVAEARSPNGLPLQIRWTADGGQFSDSNDWLPMTYSADDGLWKSSILWALPPSPAAVQNVSVEVRDEFGNSSASTAVSELVFDTDQEFPWEIFFVSRTSSSLVSSVERMNGDGSGRVKIIEDEERPPQILSSPNGEFVAWKTGDYTIERDLYISSREGDLLRTVTFPKPINDPLKWSSDSTSFVAHDSGQNPTTIWSVNVATGARSVWATIPSEAIIYSASADLRYFAYKDRSRRHQAVVFDRDSGTSTVIFTSPGSSYGPVDFQLSARGNYCGFYDQNTPGYESILARTDGSGHLNLGYGGVVYVSPDETSIVYNQRSAPRGGTDTFVVGEIDGTTRFTKTGLENYSTFFTPDSKFAVQQPRSFADYRLQAVDLVSGDVLEICPDDGLQKFRLGFSSQ